jgi:hypothetical protein
VQPILWRAKFPVAVSESLVSFDNPTGTISNSDLELHATIMHHDVLVQCADLRERTIHTFHDNTPAVAWQCNGSTTTTGPAAYLLRFQALHQRFHRYLPLHDYIPGPINEMADKASRLWDLSDDEIISHFNLHYPQTLPWLLCPVRHATFSALTSALFKQRSAP